LNKDNVTYLVNRYLNEDVSPEERDRIVNTPKLALPNGLKRRSKNSRDNSASARLSRAIAGCLDSNAYLSKLLASVDVREAAVRITDVESLADSLAALRTLLMTIFYPGKGNGGGDAHD
jgi:hypothetical protein